MSKEGRKAVLLTNDGAFKSVKLKRTAEVAIGQTILSKHLSQPCLLKKYFLIPMLAACLSFSFVALSNSSYESKADAAAYVSFDIIPSIEATINQDYNILSVQTMNKEAESIIPNPESFQNMPLSHFISMVMSRLQEKGYLQNNSLFLVATTMTGRVQRGDRRSFQNGEPYIARQGDASSAKQRRESRMDPRIIETARRCAEKKKKAVYWKIHAVS
ncbi:anti-sigma factor domain-containing protein [Terrilactibacillus sp. S3-3]|nr:anti-sigma factor domain-containing protein [Terrilactibacillus sp. S3-3]